MVNRQDAAKAINSVTKNPRIFDGFVKVTVKIEWYIIRQESSSSPVKCCKDSIMSTPKELSCVRKESNQNSLESENRLFGESVKGELCPWSQKSGICYLILW